MNEEKFRKTVLFRRDFRRRRLDDEMGRGLNRFAQIEDSGSVNEEKFRKSVLFRRVFRRNGRGLNRFAQIEDSRSVNEEKIRKSVSFCPDFPYIPIFLQEKWSYFP